MLFLLFGADIAAVALGRDPQLVGTAITVDVVVLIVWLTAVGPGWVMRQGNSYAESLFDTPRGPTHPLVSLKVLCLLQSRGLTGRTKLLAAAGRTPAQVINRARTVSPAPRPPQPPTAPKGEAADELSRPSPALPPCRRPIV
jgi:hypothetical protein